VVSGESAATEIQISSLIDTWLLLYNRESNGEHNRQLYLLKSRGMAHSNQVREFIMSSDGIRLRAACLGPEGVLTGSARLAQEAKDKAAILIREQEIERRTRELERRRREIAAQIEMLQAQLVTDEAEVALINREGVAREDQLAADRVAMAMSRHAGTTLDEPAKPASWPKK
jgi:circadian clock protein KaiC